jgi:plastocyanin
MHSLLRLFLFLVLVPQFGFWVEAQKNPKPPRANDAKNTQTGKKPPVKDPELARYAIFEKSAPRPEATEPVRTALPLTLAKGTRIAFIGNTLLDRAQHFGHFETALQQAHPQAALTVRNLTWAADQLGTEPRPANFADVEQHLTIAKADVIFAAYGFNESFAGESGLPEFRQKLTTYVAGLKAKAFNGEGGPQIVLVSPIANENVKGVAAADRNNKNIAAYTKVMREVAAAQGVGFADVFTATEEAMASGGSDLTINGCHLNEAGYKVFAEALFTKTFGGRKAPAVDEAVRASVIEKNKQFFRRYRPVNTFYYTGGRNRSYGYLDFLPAMRNFDIMVQNRDRRIWELAQGKAVPAKIDDSNVPPLPTTAASRGANKWMSPADELKAFKVDPRFEVNLFASEEEFPEIACPIQMRWDSQGRMWVSCSTTYPHVYPGNEPDDKLVILEDTDGDGRADKSTVFADDLHIPLSFEFGDGGVYVSEEPHLSFIKDTNGDGKADFKRLVLTGFGCEDSHHALHDFVWSPDGDLIFRESIFHHSQIETPYGPVRQQNSGWFRFEPRQHKLTSFGTYHSTNPWGVTFDDWGQHVASHPIYAQAFHALDPVYPKQHPRPAGLRAYSGTCGQEFVDFASWPKEMQGGYVKVRYKPTNRVEFHKWKKTEFGYDEEYVGDIIFSTNLSFIPVDLRYGPRGAMYVCDWYNPIKGHAQYSLRDERRDRKSGRIWRILPKGAKLATPPKIAGAPVKDLLNVLKRPEYRYRYWAKRELRERPAVEVQTALDSWVKALDSKAARHRHHQMEAVWMYRNLEAAKPALLAELLECETPEARAAATHQLRYWHAHFKDGNARLRKAANDNDPIVRMEAAIATSYIGTEAAMHALADTTKHPHGGHLAYGMRTALGASTMLPHWQFNHHLTMHNEPLRKFISGFAKGARIETDVNHSAKDAQFDQQKNLKVVRITTVKERMLYDVTRFEVNAGQPVKLEFINPDATPHNLVIVKPGTGDAVGLAATRMAADPELAKSGQYIPKTDAVLFHTKMVPPIAGETLRFLAPKTPGAYPYICTFPGHWTIMKGVMVVK